MNVYNTIYKKPPQFVAHKYFLKSTLFASILAHSILSVINSLCRKHNS